MARFSRLLSSDRLWRRALLFGGMLLLWTPLFWVIANSLRPLTAQATSALSLAGYDMIWQTLGFGRYWFNSLLITCAALFGEVLVSALAAFGLARMTGFGRRWLLAGTLLVFLLPREATLIPPYLFFLRAGWLDSWGPLILPAWFGHPAQILLLYLLLRRYPPIYDEMVLLDGGSYGTIWRWVAMPLARPALLVAVALGFIRHWQAFQIPLLYLYTPDRLTLPLAFLRAHWPLDGSGPTGEAAGIVLFLIPILICFFAVSRWADGETVAIHRQGHFVPVGQKNNAERYPDTLPLF